MLSVAPVSKKQAPPRETSQTNQDIAEIANGVTVESIEGHH